jgi:hypothetical protein
MKILLATLLVGFSIVTVQASTDLTGDWDCVSLERSTSTTHFPKDISLSVREGRKVDFYPRDQRSIAIAKLFQFDEQTSRYQSNDEFEEGTFMQEELNNSSIELVNDPRNIQDHNNIRIYANVFKERRFAITYFCMRDDT